MKCLVVLFLVVWPFLVNATALQVNFPDVDNNVAYASVASLGFNSADEKVAYGSDESQYALLWRAKKIQPQNPLVIFI